MKFPASRFCSVEKLTVFLSLKEANLTILDRHFRLRVITAWTGEAAKQAEIGRKGSSRQMRQQRILLWVGGECACGANGEGCLATRQEYT